jgi:hypothetical protein
MSHNDRTRHGWTCPTTVTVTARPARVLTRAEVAGFAASETKINALYAHGDRPSDWFWRDTLARMDAALATQGAAA